MEKRGPPPRSVACVWYICPPQKKITNYEVTMIRIICDEEVNESDIELIELFGVSLIDKDKDTMIDLMYVVEDKMSDECVCFENKCVCSMWK